MRKESRKREMLTPALNTGSGAERSPLDGDRAPCNEWCRLGRRPWYDQGWFWALLTVAGLALVAWQLGNIHAAVEASAEAARQQTDATMEQTQVMRQQAAWLEMQAAWLRDRTAWLRDQAVWLGQYLREALPVFRSG